MDTPSRARGLWLVYLALAAFTADVLIYYFTITPLRQWADARFEAEWIGTFAHYGLRAFSALLFGSAMVLFKSVEVPELGFSFRPFKEDAAWTLRLVSLLAIASVLFIAISLAVCKAMDIDMRGWRFFETDRDGGWMGYLLCSALAAPLVEEGVYRSLLTPALKAGYGPRGAIVAGALLFYVLHLVYGQPWWMFHYFIAGLILTWAYLQRGKLWICVVLHAGGNLMVVMDDALRDFAPRIYSALMG